MNMRIRIRVLLLAFLLAWIGPLHAAQERLPDGSDDVVVNAFLRDQIRSVVDQVRAYRSVLKALTENPKSAGPAKAVEARIEALLQRAGKLALENRLNEALDVADEANRLMVESIVRMRNGETAVVSLSFDSPAQEFAYEKRRFESSEIMVAMTLEEGGGALASQRAGIEALLGEARRQRELGEQEASAGRHAEAVRTLEGANRQMTRVLQGLGVPVF